MFAVVAIQKLQRARVVFLLFLVAVVALKGKSCLPIINVGSCCCIKLESARVVFPLFLFAVVVN